MQACAKMDAKGKTSRNSFHCLCWVPGYVVMNGERSKF